MNRKHSYNIKMKCVVCLELFNLASNSPTVLSPCSHTICDQCAKQLSKCPICRRIIISCSKNYGLEEVLRDVDEKKLVYIKTTITKSMTTDIENDRTNVSRFSIYGKTVARVMDRLVALIQKVFTRSSNAGKTLKFRECTSVFAGSRMISSKSIEKVFVYSK